MAQRYNIYLLIVGLVCLITIIEAKIVLERRSTPENYVLLSRANPNEFMEFRMSFRQKNIHILEAALLDVSDPESPNYAQWWTTEKILDVIAPSVEEIQPVMAWIRENGIEQIDASGRDHVKVVATIQQIERLFNTKIYYYQSKLTGRTLPRAFGQVHVPDALNIIDGIYGLTELIQPSTISPKIKPAKARSADPLGYVYPGLLRQLYDIPNSFTVNSKSSICVAEFLDSAAFNTEDLTTFNYWMTENIHVDKVVGPATGSDNPFFESSLDVQYASSIALNTTFWYWSVNGWLYELATGLFNATSYPAIVSMSWGWPSDLQCKIIGCVNSWHPTEDSFNYVLKVNTEFLKVGLKGITLVASSGDQGAPGDGHTDCSGYLSDIFPGASPWVTTVGATMLVSSGTSDDQETVAQPPLCSKVHCAQKLSEAVCSYPTSLITSGGGFADILPMPLYQKAAVDGYLFSGVRLPSTYYFNQSNRAFPDVSANGHNYVVQVYGQGLLAIDGTSCSTPVFAGVLALLNSYRADNGKNLIGFANPLLYKMQAADPSTFIDITVGNNYCTEVCCGTNGYLATPGWDAATGLGTPNFPNMLKYIKALP